MMLTLGFGFACVRDNAFWALRRHVVMKLAIDFTNGSWNVEFDDHGRWTIGRDDFWLV